MVYTIHRHIYDLESLYRGSMCPESHCKLTRNSAAVLPRYLSIWEASGNFNHPSYDFEIPWYLVKSNVAVKQSVPTLNQVTVFFTRIGCFQTVTDCFNSPMVWNDSQSVTYYRRCALLFSKVVHQISRSQRLKNRLFEPNLCEISRPVAAIKSLRFAVFAEYAYF